jgi:PmbA protein
MTSTDHDHQGLYAAIEEALRLARRKGASEASASASRGAGLSVSARLGEVDTVEHQRDQRLRLTVYFSGRKGSAASADLRSAAINDAVSAACEIARHAGEDPYAGLPKPVYLATEIPELELDHRWAIDATTAADLALATERIALEYDPRITNSDGAGVASYAGHYAYGNSHDFLAGWSSSRHSIDCTVIAEDDNGMQRDFWYTVARDPAALEAGDQIGKRAAQRALARLSARKPSTCTVPVLFENRVAAGLLANFLAAISGGALYRKSSFLLDKLGQSIFPDWFTATEQPHIRRALGSAPFDSDGVATRAHRIVENGVLVSYALSAYAARKLDMTPTGNGGGVHNFVVEPPGKPFAELLSDMHEGFLVTEMMGFGVNTVTGDYSRGASGFWVVGGEIQYPVEEATIAGNLADMFTGLLAVGDDVELRGNIRTGSLLIDKMTVAGE